MTNNRDIFACCGKIDELILADCGELEGEDRNVLYSKLTELKQVIEGRKGDKEHYLSPSHIKGLWLLTSYTWDGKCHLIVDTDLVPNSTESIILHGEMYEIVGFEMLHHLSDLESGNDSCDVDGIMSEIKSGRVCRVY